MRPPPSLDPPGRRRERADAARNRERILGAAARLFAERGVDAVSMDQIAEAAGVGKATLFRRFGDRAGLALALLDDRERAIQDAMIRGAPPLGPGAPPADRLVAFVDALLTLLEEQADLIVASETTPAGARYRSGVYAAWRLHARVLIAAARPDADADLLAENLLAPLAGLHFRHLRRDRGMPLERIRAAAADQARRIAGA